MRRLSFGSRAKAKQAKDAKEAKEAKEAREREAGNGKAGATAAGLVGPLPPRSDGHSLRSGHDAAAEPEGMSAEPEGMSDVAGAEPEGMSDVELSQYLEDLERNHETEMAAFNRAQR